KYRKNSSKGSSRRSTLNLSATPRSDQVPRLPEIFSREQLPEDKQWVHDYLIETRKKISNGFAPYLHCPEYVGSVARLGSYIRFQSSLPRHVYELVALTTSVERSNSYESELHARVLRDMGMDQTAIDAICNKTELGEMGENHAVFVRCAREMMREHGLSDASFDA